VWKCCSCKGIRFQVTAFDELQWYSVQQSYTIAICHRLQVSINHLHWGKVPHFLFSLHTIAHPTLPKLVVKLQKVGHRVLINRTLSVWLPAGEESPLRKKYRDLDCRLRTVAFGNRSSISYLRGCNHNTNLLDQEFSHGNNFSQFEKFQTRLFKHNSEIYITLHYLVSTLRPSCLQLLTQRFNVIIVNYYYSINRPILY